MGTRSCLYLRVNVSGKQKYVRPIQSGNGRLKPQVGRLNGEEIHFPGAVYALRYRSNGRRVWEQVGADPAAAVVAKNRRDKILEAAALGLEVKDTTLRAQNVASGGNFTPLSDAIQDYLAGVEAIRRPSTVKARRLTMRYFNEAAQKRHIQQIDKSDITHFINFLRAKALGNRTIQNHCAGVCSLLRANGITGITSPRDWPKYAQKEIGVFSSEEIATLFSVCDQEQRLLVLFFLGSGCRDQEGIYATYSDLDFNRKIFTVSAKVEYDFEPKSHEARSIPLPDDLIESLKQRRRSNADAKLIFPTRTGKPDGHFLRKVKRLALKAGLNCGHCINRKGLSCKSHPVCRRVDLHKFRKTFATLHHRNRVDMQTLRGWLGHANLATTQMYLKYSEIDTADTRAKVNGSFAAFA